LKPRGVVRELPMTPRHKVVVTGLPDRRQIVRKFIASKVPNPNGATVGTNVF
jgi:hypothetical protein